MTLAPPPYPSHRSLPRPHFTFKGRGAVVALHGAAGAAAARPRRHAGGGGGRARNARAAARTHTSARRPPRFAEHRGAPARSGPRARARRGRPAGAAPGCSCCGVRRPHHVPPSPPPVCRAQVRAAEERVAADALQNQVRPRERRRLAAATIGPRPGADASHTDAGESRAPPATPRPRRAPAAPTPLTAPLSPPSPPPHTRARPRNAPQTAERLERSKALDAIRDEVRRRHGGSGLRR